MTFEEGMKQSIEELVDKKTALEKHIFELEKENTELKNRLQCKNKYMCSDNGRAVPCYMYHGCLNCHCKTEQTGYDKLQELNMEDLCISPPPVKKITKCAYLQRNRRVKCKFWKVSVSDDFLTWYVKSCCLTKKQAEEIVEELTAHGIIARCSPHIK